MDLFRHIVVPLDGSELGERALEPAYRIARAMATLATKFPEDDGPVRLVLLRASSPTNLVAADPYLYDELARMAVDEAQAYLNATVAALAPSRVEVETRAVAGRRPRQLSTMLRKTGPI